MTDSPDQAVQQWEYHLLTRKTESYLLTEINPLGKEGWELVSVLYYKDLKGVMCWTAFLKRPACAHAAPLAAKAATLTAAQPSQAAGSEPAGAEGFDLGSGDFEFKDE
jgi:hypothetical protein